MTDYYPIIKIPYFLTRPNLYLDSLDDLKEPPVPQEIKPKGKSPLFIILFILLGMPLMSVSLGILGFIVSIILFIALIIYHTSGEEKNYEDVDQRNEDQIKEYKEKLQDYAKKLELKRQREIEMEAMEENPFFKIMKIWTTKIEYLESAVAPKDKIGDTKKGVTESYFYQKLVSFFGDLILTEKVLLDYTPDFIYFNPKFNLYIDIEIDEPYDGISKDPIHYIGSDDVRDTIFLNRRWCIVRFSERQITEQPSVCCEEIKRLVNRLFPAVYKSDEIKNNLIQDKRWTKRTSIKLAKDNFRDTYLFKINNYA